MTKDLKDLNINLSFSEISELSKQSFKTMVKKACKETCFQELLAEKQKLSKGKEIPYIKFETQAYLKPGNGISSDMMRKIYHTRCREIYLKCNFPSNFSDKKCFGPCSDGEDRDKHIFSCLYFSNGSEMLSKELNFENIYGHNVEQQKEIVNILYARLEVRKKYLPSASFSHDGVPIDPRKGRGKAHPRLGIREAKQKSTKNKNKTRCIKKRPNPKNV